LNGITAGVAPNSALFNLDAEEVGRMAGVMVVETGLISLKLETKGFCTVETEIIGGSAGMDLALAG
jgi:hypothetical protein